MKVNKLIKGDNMNYSNLKDGKRVAVTHGELFILPVNKVPKGKTSEHDIMVLAHSESGHNHVLETLEKGKTFSVTEVGEMAERYINLEFAAQLVHKKTFDIHETRVLAPGSYKIYKKTEYDPFKKIVRAVFD